MCHTGNRGVGETIRCCVLLFWKVKPPVCGVLGSEGPWLRVHIAYTFGKFMVKQGAT